MEETSLYYGVKKKICKMIFEDVYRDGDYIPPERKLSEELGVSRVTVRKALQLLENEKIIERIQGSGTRVALRYGARNGELDIITLVAPAQNRFFSKFIDAFQTTAEAEDCLVLYKQKSPKMSLDKCLYQIYEKDLRNVVLWQEDMEISDEALKKLRGLGMNIVLFDTNAHNEYADAICLDNKDAILQIVNRMKEEGHQKLGYVGWEKMNVKSIQMREKTFLEAVSDGMVQRISYEYHNRLDAMPKSMVKAVLESMKECDCIVYGVGDLGVFFEQYAKEYGFSHKAAMIDELPGAEVLDIKTFGQDFVGMSQKIFDCLRKQNQQESAWKAQVYRIKGMLSEDRRNENACNGN